MAIEFKEFDCGGVYFHTVGLYVQIKNHGQEARIEGDVYIHELEQILSKMKELQSGVNNG